MGKRSSKDSFLKEKLARRKHQVLVKIWSNQSSYELPESKLV